MRVVAFFVAASATARVVQTDPAVELIEGEPELIEIDGPDHKFPSFLQIQQSQQPLKPEKTPPPEGEETPPPKTESTPAP